MAPVILIANPKGGTGKTTLADELAFAYEKAGLTVSFANLDNQGGTLHSTQEQPVSDVMIVDTPGRLTDSMKDWAKDADLMLIPSNPSPRDAIPTLEFYESMKRYIPVFLVVNRFNPHRVVCKEFLVLLKEQSVPVIGLLPESTEFPKAAMERTGVIYLHPNGKPATAVKELSNTVLTHLRSNQ